MPRDAQGHAVTAASDAAQRAYDHAIEGYLTYRADTGQRLAALLAADPEFGMAQVLKEPSAGSPGVLGNDGRRRTMDGSA